VSDDGFEARSEKGFMSKVWQAVRGYIWWTHPRGNVHYDVMVTLILAFIFLTPTWVFNDKPTVRVPHQTEVVVSPDGENFIYQIDAAAVPGKGDAAIRRQLLQIIEPISGEAKVTRYEAVRDAHGQVKSYKVWVERPYR
jgi:hypothetical protein